MWFRSSQRRAAYWSVRSGDLMNLWVSLPVEVSKTHRFFGINAGLPHQKRDVSRTQGVKDLLNQIIQASERISGFLINFKRLFNKRWSFLRESLEFWFHCFFFFFFEKSWHVMRDLAVEIGSS